MFFETNEKINSMELEIATIMKELTFQMIRLDTARRSRGIRELLVARSLYATCIEPEREIPEADNSEENLNWREDQNRIFSSWSEK